MLRAALKFIFRVYVSFANPAYVDWRKLLKYTLSRVLTPSDKIFIIIIVLAAVTVVLEIIGYCIWALLAHVYVSVSIHWLVFWLLSICCYIASASIWCTGFLRHLIRFQIFRFALFRTYAWGLYVLGTVLNLGMFL
jgi:hypothetical protein